MSHDGRLRKLETALGTNDGRCPMCGDWPLPFTFDATKRRCPECGSHTFQVRGARISIVDWTPPAVSR